MLDLLYRLRTRPELFEAIAAARAEHGAGDAFRVQADLRQRFPEDLVRAALQVADLRVKATPKFSRASQLWFDRIGLEQATTEAVAHYKAARFRSVCEEGTRVYDLCSGVGGDALALGQHLDVTAVDRDPAMLARLLFNADAYGVRPRMHDLCANVEDLGLKDAVLHIDPDRRTAAQKSGSKSRRSLRLEQMQPSLDVVQGLIARNRAGCVKLSPASNFGGKFDGCTIELVSLDRECKEASVWFGELREAAPLKATVLPEGESISGDPLDAWTVVEPPGEFLFDPDPSVVRAGLVDLLAERLGLWRLDDAEEYLSGADVAASPFVRAYRILERLPHREGKLKTYFRTSDVGTLDIKCRHVKVDADTLRKRLTLPGTKRRTLVIAKVAGATGAFLCEPVG